MFNDTHTLYYICRYLRFLSSLVPVEPSWCKDVIIFKKIEIDKEICRIKRNSLASLVHNNLFRSLVTTMGCDFYVESNGIF